MLVLLLVIVCFLGGADLIFTLFRRQLDFLVLVAIICEGVDIYWHYTRRLLHVLLLLLFPYLEPPLQFYDSTLQIFALGDKVLHSSLIATISTTSTQATGLTLLIFHLEVGIVPALEWTVTTFVLSLIAWAFDRATSL